MRWRWLEKGKPHCVTPTTSCATYSFGRNYVIFEMELLW